MALPPFNLLPLYQSRPLITRAVVDGGKKLLPPLWHKKELMHQKASQSLLPAADHGAFVGKTQRNFRQ